MKENWNIDKKKKNKYIAKCKLFVKDDDAFKNFRRDEDYGQILEGNESDVALIALLYLTQHGGGEFINRYYDEFILNDSVGNPVLYEGKVSAATIRYINSAYEITKLLGDYRPKRILEIGGGYGGLCRILSVVYNFNEYTNKDLPEAEALFNKYISHFPNLEGKVNNTVSGKYDLFIADSSLSECYPSAQKEYIKMAMECDYIFLVYNTFHIKNNQDTFDEFFDELSEKFTVNQVPPITTNKGTQDFANTYLFRRK